MTEKFKVWIQVERIDEENDSYTNATEPEDMATFDTRGEAVNYVASLAPKSTSKTPRLKGKGKLAKPWVNPKTETTRIYVNGLGLGEGYRVYFELDGTHISCKLSLPTEVWQDAELRGQEQNRFDEEIKGQLIANHKDAVIALLKQGDSSVE